MAWSYPLPMTCRFRPAQSLVSALFFLAAVVVRSSSPLAQTRPAVESAPTGVPAPFDTNVMRIPAERPHIAAKTAKDALHSPSGYSDLPIRVTSFSSRDAGGKIKVVAAVEPLDPAARLTSAAAGLYDAGGKIIAEWASKPEDLVGPPVRASLLAPPGTFRLRVAGLDAAGRVGTVDSPVTTDLVTAGSLTLSSLMLGRGGPTAGSFTPVFEFGTEPTAVVSFELYGGRTNMPLRALVELAQSVNGPAMLTARLNWAGTVETDRFVGTAQLPLASVPPGDYVVRAIVALDGEPEGRVIRTLRKR